MKSGRLPISARSQVSANSRGRLRGPCRWGGPARRFARSKVCRRTEAVPTGFAADRQAESAREAFSQHQQAKRVNSCIQSGEEPKIRARSSAARQGKYCPALSVCLQVFGFESQSSRSCSATVRPSARQRRSDLRFRVVSVPRMIPFVVERSMLRCRLRDLWAHCPTVEGAVRDVQFVGRSTSRRTR